MVARQLYVIRWSSLQKVLSKQLLSLLSSGGMSWRRLIYQGSVVSLFSSVAFFYFFFFSPGKKSLFHEFLNNISSLKVVLVSGSSYIMRAETLFVLTQLIRLHDHRTTHSLLSATVHVTEKYLRQETLGAVSFRSKFRPHFDFVVIIIFLLLVVFFVLCINCSVLLQVFSLTIRRYVPWPRTRVRKSYSMKYWLQQKGTLFQRIYLDCEVAGQYRMHSTWVLIDVSDIFSYCILW